MKYEGRKSLPLIDMAFRVRFALEELDISVPWNDDGPVCELDVPRNGSSLKIRHEFSARAGALLVTTILLHPIPGGALQLVRARLASLPARERARAFLAGGQRLALSQKIEAVAADVTVLFMGRLLERTTKQLIAWAEELGVLASSQPSRPT